MENKELDIFEREINDEIESWLDNPVVIAAMDLIKRAEAVQAPKREQWTSIFDLWKAGYSTDSPKGTKRLWATLFQKVVTRIVSKLKPLDAMLHWVWATEDEEKITTSWITTVLEEWGLTNALRDKFWAFYRMCLFWDTFIRIWVEPKKWHLVKFQNTSLLNIYVDPYATEMRNASAERDVNELVAIYRYSYDEMCTLYPWYDKKGWAGKISRQWINDSLDISPEQETETNDRVVEVAHYYNIITKRYTVFAWTECTVLQDLKWDDYPYILKKADVEIHYVPFMHLMCFPSIEGFYNNGIWQLLYRYAVVLRQLDNKAINYGIDNIDPTRMINVPKWESAKFMKKLLQADRAKAAWKKGFVINEYSTLDWPSNTNMETFSSPQLTGEYERLTQRLDQEIMRMIGMSLDSADRGAARTATQIMSEENTSNDFVKQILEQNAWEFKFAYDVTMDLIKRYGKNSKVPINMTTNIVIDNKEGQWQKELPIKDITIWDIADQLNRYHYFVKIDSRSGSIKSNVLEQAYISSVMNTTAPWTPAYTKLQVKLARSKDLDLAMEDFAPQQQPEMPQWWWAGWEVPSDPTATATDPSSLQEARSVQPPQGGWMDKPMNM